MKAVLKMREAEQRSDKRRPESPGKESWNSAKPFLTCRQMRMNKEPRGVSGVGAGGATEMPREAAAGEEQAPPPGT